MTLYEIIAILEAYNLESRRKLVDNYNLAYMVADFVNRMMANKKIPSVDEMFPSVDFADSNSETQANQAYAAQFAAFAAQFNAQRKETH